MKLQREPAFVGGAEMCLAETRRNLQRDGRGHSCKREEDSDLIWKSPEKKS